MITCVSERSGMASIGVFRNAQKPAAAKPKRNRKTMKRLRALKSMMRSTIRVPSVLHSLHPADRRFQPALRINQEVGRGHHVVPFSHSLDHLDPVPGPGAELHRPPLQGAAAVMN